MLRHAVRYCNIATCLVGCERGARCLLDRKFGRAHAEKRPIYATCTNLCAQSTAAMQLHASRESEAPLARREARHAQWQWQRCFRRCKGARLLIACWVTLGVRAAVALGPTWAMGRQWVCALGVDSRLRQLRSGLSHAGRMPHNTGKLGGSNHVMPLSCCGVSPSPGADVAGVHTGAGGSDLRDSQGRLVIRRKEPHPHRQLADHAIGPRLPRLLQFGDSKDRGNQASWRGRS
jgi:hypothetical protein